MYRRNSHNLLKLFLAVTFFLSIIPNPGKAENLQYALPTNQNLATQSIFDPINDNETFKIKDLALAESLVFGHLKMDNDFLLSKGIIEENISEQTKVKYDFNNLETVEYDNKTLGYILPLVLEYYDINTRDRTALREYFVYVSPETNAITSFTKEERDRLINANISFVHAQRSEVEEIRSFIDHELWTDTPLMQLAAQDLSVFGEMDRNVQIVTSFLKAVGSKRLALDFLSLVKEGRVYRVNRNAEVDIPGYGLMKVNDDRIKVDHASNIGIYVKDRVKHKANELQIALIHETLAKAGVIASVNDDQHINELLNRTFTAFINEDNFFKTEKSKFSYAVNRALEDEKIDQTLENLSFNNVDLNNLKDRDLSFPADRKQRLMMAKKAISAWKKQYENKEHWEDRTVDAPAVSRLQKEVLAIYNKYKLYELSTGEILEYAFEAFDGNNYPIVKNTVEHLIFNLSDFDLSSRPHELTPNNFHEVARELGYLKVEGSFSDVNNINFVFHRMIFDFFRTERRIAELSWMAQEIQKERDFPGSARLPMICAVQDLHGAATRAMALVGYAAGLKPDVLDSIESVKDPSKYLEKLQDLLKEAGIEMSLQDILFVGMNDIYDRGENPVGTFELLKWLSEKQKLKYVVGNHDLWRAMGVLGVHRYYKEINPEINLSSKEHKGHSAPFWSKEAWEHAGWGPTEIDQVNEEKVNKQIRGINDRLRRSKKLGVIAPSTPLLEKVNLRPARQAFAQNVKIMKAYNLRISTTKEIDEVLERKLKSLETAGILTAGQILSIKNRKLMDLPDTLEVTMNVLEEQIKNVNEAIDKINKDYNLDIWPIKVHLVDYDNYYKDPGVIKRTLWQMKKFRLFYVDIFGFVHLHGVIPFNNENKKINVEYMGQTGLEALELMQSKVQLFFQNCTTIKDTPEWRVHMMEEIGDILELVNSWYSDKTKTAKPKKVNEFVQAGGLFEFTEIGKYSAGSAYYSDRTPTAGLITGHNPMKSFDPDDFTDTPLPWMFPYPGSETFHLQIDYGMSEGYQEQGGMFTVFKRDETGAVTGLRSWGIRDPKGRVIEDITNSNLKALSKEQKSFLLKLSHSDALSEKQKNFLIELSRENIDTFNIEDKEGWDYLFDLASQEKPLEIMDNPKSNERMKQFLDLLLRGERFGLSSQQKQMIKNMSDGQWFMRWFQVKALKQVYEYADNLVKVAEKKERFGKKEKLENRRNNAADQLEKFGILIRPDLGNALNVIAEMEGQKDAVFSHDEFFNLRVEEEKSNKYKDVIPESDRKMTEDNIQKEVDQLLDSGFIEEVEGGYKATPLIAGLDKARINALISRIPELKEGNIDPETTDKLKDEVVKVKMDIIHEQKLVEDVIDSLITGKTDLKRVYHLLPEKLIPMEQRWIIQRIKSVERNSTFKEKIIFLNDEEYDNYEDVAAKLVQEGFFVDIALLNPTDNDVMKLNSDELKGKVKAFVFEQEEIGNFQQLEGIICALRALYNVNRTSMINALNELNLILTGEDLSVDMVEALKSVNINDPVEMYKRGIKFILPPIEIKDWQKLKELNKIMQRVLTQA